MPTGKHVVKNVPNNQLSKVVFGFVAQGAHVTTLPEPDGEWTVIAVFAPEEGDATGSTKSMANVAAGTSGN